MKPRTWYFLDIDGCILPNIFDNTFYTNDQEKLESIIKAYQKAKDVSLYPEFVEWWNRNVIKTINKVRFITGRQEDIFGWLTKTQLKPLILPLKEYIYYYPNHFTHDWNLYLRVKINKILEIIETKFDNANYTEEVKIYDDHDFSKELKENLEYPFEFHLIQSKEDWCEL